MRREREQCSSFDVELSQLKMSGESRGIIVNDEGDEVEVYEDELLLINRNFPETPFNWSIIIGSNSVILVVNIVVLLWGKIKVG